MTTDNNVFRTTFRKKQKRVIDICRKLHIEKLHNFYSLTDLIRATEGRRTYNGQAKYGISVGKKNRRENST
jgi:predicted MarR family transcription regulator